MVFSLLVLLRTFRCASSFGSSSVSLGGERNNLSLSFCTLSERVWVLVQGGISLKKKKKIPTPVSLGENLVIIIAVSFGKNHFQKEVTFKRHKQSYVQIYLSIKIKIVQHWIKYTKEEQEHKLKTRFNHGYNSKLKLMSFLLSHRDCFIKFPLEHPGN